MTQTVHIRGDYQRRLAHQLIDKAPLNAVVKVSPEKRSPSQNDKMWAMLSDVSRQKPQGRKHTPEVWKAIFMGSFGYEARFEHDLDGRPFPIGFRTSQLTVPQMRDLIEFIYAYGSKNEVKWSEEYQL